MGFYDYSKTPYSVMLKLTILVSVSDECVVPGAKGNSTTNLALD
jgi:hypothetical protein